jgi:hypothetical protein
MALVKAAYLGSKLTHYVNSERRRAIFQPAVTLRKGEVPSWATAQSVVVVVAHCAYANTDFQSLELNGRCGNG